MIEYVDCVVIPYVVEMTEDQPALAIFDVFAAHRPTIFIKSLYQQVAPVNYNRWMWVSMIDSKVS